MDLQDQLKNLFPDHEPELDKTEEKKEHSEFWIQDSPLICKYEKRKGKPITIIEGYNGATDDFKKLTKALKQLLSVGGSHKNDTIIIQGDYRDKIMTFLKESGFTIKRVGG
ncbi:translation initiation factor [Croceivirga sp. JEA036]|uniref:translation initiation factor n=1 Tax=Croceivirga sp. JEA036 TaxID=2721162 RepID=UPI00143A6514|nr:translation initiation factor [Croceivirga sp. JEA036]NJB35702.1 translation initiation factor [Croceivirga sp. JEA036]